MKNATVKLCLGKRKAKAFLTVFSAEILGGMCRPNGLYPCGMAIGWCIPKCCRQDTLL